MLFLIGMTLLASVASSVACVGCREPGADSIANEPATALAGFGFSWGVLFMLAILLSLLGGLVAYIWRSAVEVDRLNNGERL